MRLLQRKLPTYESMKHYGGLHEDYAPDYERPSRGRYKRHHGVTVYEGGYIEVNTWVNHNPDARRTLELEFGLQVVLTSEITGLLFFTPDGVPVPKSGLDDVFIFLDQQTKRAYGYGWAPAARGAQPCISFACPTAVPTAGRQIMTKTPDMVYVKAVLKEHKDWFKACASVRDVSAEIIDQESVKRATPVEVDKVLQAILAGESPGNVSTSVMVSIGDYVVGPTRSGADVGIKARLAELCTVSQGFPWLRIEQKEYK